MGSYSAKVIARLPMVEEAKGPVLSTSEKVAQLCRDMEGLAQETFHLLTLNQKNRMIDRHLVSIGSLTGAIVHPREVFRLALLDCAAAVVFIHNHPTGNEAPSLDDIKLTSRLVAGAELLGIRVVDHVIIGRDGRFTSFHDVGLLQRESTGSLGGCTSWKSRYL